MLARKSGDETSCVATTSAASAQLFLLKHEHSPAGACSACEAAAVGERPEDLVRRVEPPEVAHVFPAHFLLVSCQ